MPQPLQVRLMLLEKSLPARRYWLTLEDDVDHAWVSGSIRPEGETGVVLGFTTPRSGLIRLLMALLGKVEKDDRSDPSLRFVIQ